MTYLGCLFSIFTSIAYPENAPKVHKYNVGTISFKPWIISSMEARLQRKLILNILIHTKADQTKKSKNKSGLSSLY